MSLFVRRATPSLLRPFTRPAQVRYFADKMESTGEGIKQAGQAFKSDGAVGKEFEADGAIGGTAEAVGGPFSKDGAIGSQFTESGSIGGTAQKAGEKAEQAGEDVKKD